MQSPKDSELATVTDATLSWGEDESDRPASATEDEPGFQAIFDGKTLTGWEGNPTYWRVENGVLVGEITPRLTGYDPGVSQASFGLEMRSGGHAFQINVSNGIGTTFGQVARGALNNDSWFIGFNIARKFF